MNLKNNQKILNIIYVNKFSFAKTAKEKYKTKMWFIYKKSISNNTSPLKNTIKKKRFTSFFSIKKSTAKTHFYSNKDFDLMKELVSWIKSKKEKKIKKKKKSKKALSKNYITNFFTKKSLFKIRSLKRFKQFLHYKPKLNSFMGNSTPRILRELQNFVFYKTLKEKKTVKIPNHYSNFITHFFEKKLLTRRIFKNTKKIYILNFFNKNFIKKITIESSYNNFFKYKNNNLKSSLETSVRRLRKKKKWHKVKKIKTPFVFSIKNKLKNKKLLPQQTTNIVQLVPKTSSRVKNIFLRNKHFQIKKSNIKLGTYTSFLTTIERSVSKKLIKTNRSSKFNTYHRIKKKNC